jgi:adenine-specific DNA-methyltransferase
MLRHDKGEGNLTTLDQAHIDVQELSKGFNSQKQYYLSSQYSEADVRIDFINKFFIALGWDVLHNLQKNPFEQEVKVERNVDVGPSQRRADYAFYVTPNFRDVRFYVEAKKPFGDIATKDNYFQVIRYGWNSQTPIAVLTNFEQFHIIDCRYKPDIDTALDHVIKKFHYFDYLDTDKFAEIYYLFSREAMSSHSLEKFAETLPKRRGKAVQRGLFKGGYQSIDEAFLEELDEYRDVLARNFKNHNPELDGETLTEITQRTIDRLVFLRFLEDKLIETKESVSGFGAHGSVWSDFIASSRRLNGIYNGIVYKEHPLLDSIRLKVDEDSFGDICEELALVNSPYDFNVIPIHILGSIYERFLGKIIVRSR